MRLAVVADEIGTSIEEQIDSLKKANISNIELRKIDDKYLWEFSKEELINFKKILDRENIKVITLDSPVGKKPIPYERKMEIFDICPVCMWENTNTGEDQYSAPNRSTLKEYRQAFLNNQKLEPNNLKYIQYELGSI